ncbi:MAG: tripartite tricarboxylate transporter substrate-binding protein [Gammaproteobacteria bacterium]
MFMLTFWIPSYAQLPESPMRIIWPYAPGGGGDVLVRLVADQLRADLDRPVVVENRAGADGRIGVQTAKAAAPDGTTLLAAPIAPMAIFQHVHRSLGYDPLRDFQAVTQLATFDFAIGVGPHVPAKSLREYVAWVKADPSRGNYAVPGAGTLPHFFAALFGKMNDLQLTYVAYKGMPEAMADLLGGHVPAVFTSTNQLVPMHKAGRIRILATSDTQRSSFLPDVPTFREESYSIQGTGWFGIFAPVGTPMEAVERLNQLIVAALRRPEVKERIFALGLQPAGTSVAKFTAIQRADAELWAPAVQASGFTVE